MGRPNWHKPNRRRSLYRRWRPWLFGWKSIFPVMLLVIVGQFYTEGAVTWPDGLMRSADGFVRSAHAQFNSQHMGDLPAEAVEYRVSRIVDGDTVYLKDGTKVRLHGIDTPERDQLYGKQATRSLDKLIGGKVFVVEKDTDRYGRLVGTLYTPEGVNVNLEMVCNGSAWWYSRYAKNNRAMASCQDEAKEARLGLWADDDPMRPWEWRRR
jgi:endonuclease YncB( thermonuclease family)